MSKNILRIDEIILPINQSEKFLLKKIIGILEIKENTVVDFNIVKKAIDARNKRQINFVYSVEIKIEKPEELIQKIEKKNLKKFRRHRLRLIETYNYEIKTVKREIESRPVVVGSGPAGLFAGLVLARAGLKPLIIERGKPVEDRVKDIDKFRTEGILNTESNIQFGEGGAGTFSDGKLNTLITNHRIKYIFEEFVKAGAPESILSDAHPHIGTDNLKVVVKNLREKIISLGGEFRFFTCLTDLNIKEGKLESIIVNDGEEIKTYNLILAIGHSARDSYEKLYKRDLEMEAKAFSIGVRIEHKVEMINKCQYGEFYNDERLGTARYKLVAHIDGGRSVYTFCMCPGGYVMAAASEKERLVVNGMSEYNRDAENSNSALLVNVFPEDFNSDHPLAGVEFQREWESKAFLAGGSDYFAPVQLVGDFLKNKKSEKFGKVIPSYKPGTNFARLDECLPSYVAENIRKALPILDKKIKGFASDDAVLTAIESRSSSPVKFYRDENHESNIKGIYPAGEGAGYAGGIVSSAVDGLLVAESIIEKYL